MDIDKKPSVEIMQGLLIIESTGHRNHHAGAPFVWRNCRPLRRLLTMVGVWER